MKAVERVFNGLSKEIEVFQGTTGLSCISGCGLCCYKKDITATPLEFLPLAYHLFKEKKALQWLQQIKADTSPLCPVLNTLIHEKNKGHCSQYSHRGLICRLFGFSAFLDKYGTPVLSTCKPIKSEMQEKFEAANAYVRQGGKVAIMRNYYFKLSAIDPELNMRFYPIREAVIRALEVVLSYYNYRRRAI